VAGKRRWLGPVTVALGLLPLAKAGLALATGALGANPIAEVMNRLGFWTITFLALSLVPTPLNALAGVAWPLRIRRHLGLLAFTYGALHLGWYLVADQFFDWGAILADVAKRRFIAVGFATFLLLVPLAVTSTDGWVRRLGYRRWKALHRLAYLAALGGVLHFVWRVKIDLTKPLLFAAAFGVLLLARAALWLRDRQRAARPARGAVAPQ
jgi:sulfoxide reductase heme-binding subunit YedZ